MPVGERGELKAKEFKANPLHVRNMRGGWKDRVDKLEELAESLKTGQYDRIKIFDGDKIIFDGHERVEAAIRFISEEFELKYEVVPKCSDQDNILGQLIMDNHRDPLTRCEKAMAFKYLRDVYNMKGCDIAMRHSVSESTVSQLLKLSDHNDLMDDLDNNRKTWEQVRAILYPGDEEKSLHRKVNANNEHGEDSTEDELPEEIEGLLGKIDDEGMRENYRQLYGSGEIDEDELRAIAEQYESEKDDKPPEPPKKPSTKEPELADNGKGLGREDTYEILDSELPKFLKKHIARLPTSDVVGEFHKRVENLSNDGFTKEIRASHCKDIRNLESSIRVLKKKLGMVKYGKVIYNMRDGKGNRTKAGWITESNGRVFIEEKGSSGGKVRIEESCIKKIDYKHITK